MSNLLDLPVCDKTDNSLIARQTVHPCSSLHIEVQLDLNDLRSDPRGLHGPFSKDRKDASEEVAHHIVATNRHRSPPIATRQ